MRLQLLTEGWEARWDDFITRHPGSTCYHLRCWKNAAEHGYGIPAPFAMAVDESDTVRGVLPLFQLRGVVKAHLTNGLFGAYAPVLADNAAAEELLLETAFDLVRRKHLPHLVLKMLEGQALPKMRKLDSWVIATLPLERDPEKSWARLRRKIRNCVGKAVREGVTAHWGREHLDEFYDVLAENMHSKGAPVYGLSFMRELLRAAGPSADVLLLKHRGRAVAGAFVLLHRETISIPFASSRPGDRPLKPSNLLVWEVMKRGCESGMKVLDFGRSLRESTSLDFKLGWGAEVYPQPVYVHTARGGELELDPGEVKWFTGTWRRLPRPIVDRIGPLICRQIAGFL